MLSRIAAPLLVLVILAASSLAPTCVWGGEESSEESDAARLKFKIGGYQFTDSEDFVQRYGQAWAEFYFTKKIFLRATALHQAFTQNESEFGADGVDFVLGTTFGTGSELTVGAGLTGYDSIGGDFSETGFSYLSSFAFKPTKTSHLTLAFDHKKLVHSSKSIGALRDMISANEFRPSYYQWINQRWSFWAGLGYGSYSDENTRMSFNASITFLIRPEPSFGLSYAAGYTGYEQRSEQYWDPEGYTSHNLILWLQQPLGKYFSFEFKGSPGYSPSEGEPNAWGSLLLDIHPMDRLSVQMNGYLMGNPGRGSNYSASTLSADLIWSP